MRISRDGIAACLATAVVVLFVVLGFLRTHGPRTQRIIKTDEVRLMNLSRVANEIVESYPKHDKQLPFELSDVQKKEYADPERGRPPDYSRFSRAGRKMLSI